MKQSHPRQVSTLTSNPMHNNRVCSTWGKYHIKMFDGEVYQFPGTCNYVLTSQCGSAYEDFNIQIRRTIVNNQPWISHVTMKLDGTVVELSNGTISVNSKPIFVKKLFLLINVHLGLKVSPIDFGNFQKMDGPKETCEDVVPPPVSNKTQNMQILSSPVFAGCNALVSIDPFVQACVKDMVDCVKDKNSSCLCYTVSEYTRQCTHAGGQPQNWRTAEFCPKKCPQNLVYSECGSPCINTCSHPVQNQLCAQHCTDGCFCPPGTVFDNISKKGCIPVTKCSCTHNDKVYLPGESYSRNCHRCTCARGLWNCEDLECPGTCAVEGGSHINSFDGTQFTFHGDCTYLLSKVRNSFVILAEIVKCGVANTETCLKSVTLSMTRMNQVSSSEANFTVFMPSTFHMIIDTSFGVQLQIQLIPLMQVYVTLDASFKSQTCGLCGNFNNVQADDFNTNSGVVEGTASAFANTWKTMATCSDVADNYEDPCSQSVENEKFAKHWCSLLSDPSGPFAPCHDMVVSSTYEKTCMHDVCTYEQSEDLMCAAVSSYVRACAVKGVLLNGWRSNICMNYSTSCPETMTYSYSMTSCGRTCRSLSEPDPACNVQFVPVDGCGCKERTYMDDSGKCVPESNCPCYSKGVLVKAGEVVTKNGVMCTCSQGKLRCMESNKPICKKPMQYLNCSNIRPGSPGSECQKSCQTLHMECYSKACVSGCVCPDGLVSNGQGCIPASQCPCIHNGITYQPGQKIQVDCNTCTCNERKWNCTNQQCYGSCVIQGEGHYLTFDGKRFSFNGNCEYTIVQDYCGNNPDKGTFRVITENIPCGSTGTTCSKAIKLFLGQDEIRLSDGQYEVIKRDISIDLPYKISYMGMYLVMEIKPGLILMWDKKTSVHIKLSPLFKGNVCGLCGNFDGNANNDFTTSSQSVVVNALEFGNSWKVSPSCPDAKLPKDPCISNPYRQSWAQKQCSIIKSKVFAACHRQVDPTPYYDACVYDSCACDSGGDCECFCTSVAAYAAACNEANVCISWRRPDICPLFCDYYNGPDQCEWHHKPCGGPCIRTCRNPNGTCSTQIPRLEGKACTCIYNMKRYPLGALLYNTTDGIGGCISATCGANSTIIREVHSCTTTTVSPATTFLNETWNIDKCTLATCKGNNEIQTEGVKCKPVKQMTCANGRPAHKVYDDSGCCYDYECECVCEVVNVLHHVTFDGTSYIYRGNCTYVLVQQINNKYDDFRIYINEQQQELEKDVGSQSLWIFYKSNSVYLTREQNMNKVTMDVFLNDHQVFGSVNKDGFKVYTTGVLVYVEIPSFQGLVVYGGTFSRVQLPYKLFFNNTEGLCGTCTNDQKDDCRLPDGTISASCTEMPPYWLTSDQNNTVCAPETKPTVNMYPTLKGYRCNYALVVLYSVFAECHKLLPPDAFYNMCKADGCQVNTTTLECSNLQNYASMCAELGVCINWRNYTDGKCCKDINMFQTFGVSDLISRYNEEFVTKDHKAITIAEGCFCPNKTTLFNSQTDTCVSSCGKIFLIFPVFFQPNEIWQSNCHQCVCDKESMSIQCKPLQCPLLPVPSCNKDGQVLVTEPMVNNSCCNVSKCGESHITIGIKIVLKILCEAGYQLVARTPTDGCCPVYDCVCQLVHHFKNFNLTNISSREAMNRFILLLFNMVKCCLVLLSTGDEKPKQCKVHKNTTYITHEGCQSLNPVAVSSCEGACNTYSMYSSEANAMEHKCSCCQEVQTSFKNTTLKCSNGTIVSYSYIYVEECSCRDTRCEAKDHFCQWMRTLTQSKGQVQESAFITNNHQKQQCSKQCGAEFHKLIIQLNK
uniref:Mucin-5AC n=1 Tax=Erpetoichthys calabaricus TaxID=27687 RepID=A0A8C4T9V2_ERPCA